MQLEKMFIEELQPFNNNGYNTGSGKQLTEY
jgi:hypothetical protein